MSLYALSRDLKIPSLAGIVQHNKLNVLSNGENSIVSLKTLLVMFLNYPIIHGPRNPGVFTRNSRKRILKILMK